MEFENRGLFSAATQQGRKGKIFKLCKKRGFESCSNISFNNDPLKNHSIETEEEMKSSLDTCSTNNLDI